MHRDILHVYIPIFPITLARASDLSLRRRPVAVAPSHSERASVQCVSSEARSDGVFEGMPLFRARRLCPSLTVLPPDPGKVSRGGRALVNLIREYTPLWEPSSPGRLYLDLTGSGRLLGPGRDAALRLEKDIGKKLNFSGVVGVAGNKLVSRIASGCLDKPGICDVLRGSEAGFIAPMPASVLPGVGSVRERTLMMDLNLRSVGQIASLSVPQLSVVFGPFALLLHARAVGLDPSPVIPPRQAPDVTQESRLDEGENDDDLLLAELYRMAEGCGRQLRRTGRRASRLELALTYSDGLRATRTARLYVSLDNDRALFAAVSDLFFETSTRRVSVSSMRLTCCGLKIPDPQMGLFAHTGEETAHAKQADSLQEAIDAVRQKFGAGAVRWGRSITSVQSAECTFRSRHGRDSGPAGV
jgi:DNA polymerase-4